MLSCMSENTQKWVLFSGQGSDLSRSEIRVSYLTDIQNFWWSRSNFRDMGPFENPPDTHVNIGFNRSAPPGSQHVCFTVLTAI